MDFFQHIVAPIIVGLVMRLIDYLLNNHGHDK
ncbi:MAG: type I toxin-antitoxin system Fst family toxin [Lactobacillus sp.]|nr:type I toxin-antitoxin system Fst family toxin [Lactobacillus sp.]MCH3906197.1 type I toxin-antitoxin system Fst family toxin [Lactobacillus sp.]MCH3990225.1 type I toxin-antitoxin system Fst family toxin [Lactobacillus sp.]MCH4069061.1 type I toxin-antitoxin system Fst family toxin [Lactobacillus sp.]MCI1303952.1 type I toxin-antitoxin system Fst family toxin [Lactobacillus sp.]